MKKRENKKAQIWIDAKNISSRFLVQRKLSTKAQVWIETVIYTSIAIVLIGLVLTYAKPKIKEFQDKAILDQSIEMFRLIDERIAEIGVSGNQRVLKVELEEGELKIDSANDKIAFEMKSSYQYSQPGQEIIDSFDKRIKIFTENKGEINKVNFTVDYSEYGLNLSYGGKETFKTIGKAPLPYKIIFTNEGKVNGLTFINITLGS